LFTGEYEHVIDAKQRLAIPAELRSQLDPKRHGEGFYVVMGQNDALWVWPERTFESMAGALEGSLLQGEEMMEYEEMLFSQAAKVEFDKSGRIRLPERVIKLGRLGQQVVVLGVKDHLELRDREEWEARRQDKLAQQREIMARARRAWQEQQRKRNGEASA